MILRSLELKDVQGILEWMKDSEINCFFRFNSEDITQESITMFIQQSLIDCNNRHYAIVDSDDNYLGTISLKNIDIRKSAEYAISLRKCAIGRGVAREATEEVLKIAFDILKLQKVFLNVLCENVRAIKFYEKVGFRFQGETNEYFTTSAEYKHLRWYYMIEEQYKSRLY